MAEFSKVLDVSNLNIPDNGVLVIWDFILPSGGNDSDENSSYFNEVIPEEHSDPEAEESRHTTHTVTFKLIGCTKEARYHRVCRRPEIYWNKEITYLLDFFLSQPILLTQKQLLFNVK